MDYHLDRKIRLSFESEYENLYKWSIQEVNEDGSQIGENQVPWNWRTYFTITSLDHRKSVDRHINYESSEKDDLVTEVDELIVCNLQPGVFVNGEFQDQIRYSMFGASREVTKFMLRIAMLNEGEVERCRIDGGVSNTCEIDFRDVTDPDWIEISLFVKPDYFNELVLQIRSNQIVTALLNFDLVPGFYSEWSPSISTSNIKVLVQGSEHEIEAPDGSIKPPRLGEIKEFEFITQSKCDCTIEEKGENEEGDLEDDWDGEPEEPKEIQIGLKIIELLVRNESAISKLYLPVWLLVITLVLLVIKYVF